MNSSLTTVAYIGAIILFILSLGGLSNPETSRRGNLYGIIGMVIAVLATVLGPRVARGRHPVDRRGHGGRRGDRTLRRAHGADDADAGAGGAHAQPGRPRRLSRRLRELHRHLGRVRGGREGDPRNRDLRRRADRRGDLFGLGDRVRQAVGQVERQADADTGPPLDQPRSVSWSSSGAGASSSWRRPWTPA